MAQIELRLSSKIQKETGKTEVMICLRYSGHDLSARSGIFVNPSFFEYFVDRKKTINPKKPFPENKQTATREKAEKNGWVLRKSGVITTSNNKLQTPETVYHNTQSARMEDLRKFIIDSFNQETDKDSLTSGWLKSIIDEFHNPKATQNHKSKKRNFYEIADEYVSKPHGKQNAPLAKRHQDVYRVLLREVARFEGFVRATDRSRKSFKFDVDTVTKDDIQLFADYLRDEKKLSEQYPTIYKRLIEKYPPTASMRRVRQTIEPRGTNTIIKALTRLKSLFKFFFEKGYTTNNPFLGYNIGTEKVGTPIYITIDERNTIAQADLKSGWEQMSNEDKKGTRMTLKTLCEQRDIFVFHCLVGCRVGDLIKLTEQNLNNNILFYTPHKTRNNGAQAEQARIPLHAKALALVEKYRGIDAKGRLFPFLSAQRYNDAIKVIFRLAGITRNVEIRNPLTGENEWVGIDTIASSHMARRTFIGNAYFKVSDPSIISKMSGHTDGSRAFRRYRNIEDETLKNVIDQIG